MVKVPTIKGGMISTLMLRGLPILVLMIAGGCSAVGTNAPAAQLDCAAGEADNGSYSHLDMSDAAQLADTMLDQARRSIHNCRTLGFNTENLVEDLGDRYEAAGMFSAEVDLYKNYIDTYEPTPGTLSSMNWSALGRQDGVIAAVYERVYPRLVGALEKAGSQEEALLAADRDRAVLLYSDLAEARTGQGRANAGNPVSSVQAIRALAERRHSTFVFYRLVRARGSLTTTLANSERVDIWVVRPDGVIAFTQSALNSDSPGGTPVRPPDALHVIEQTRGLETSASSDATDVDREFSDYYELLVKPIEQYLPNDPDEEITIIPDHDIGLVPFYALRDGSGRSLIDLHTFAIAPSIRILAILDSAARSTTPIDWGQVSGDEVLVVGNPLMPGLPDAATISPTGSDPEIRQLPDLAGAEDEARAVADLFRAEPIIGADATATKVLPALKTARVAHFATHGLLDEPSEFLWGSFSASMSEDFAPGAIAIAPDSNQKEGPLARGFLVTDDLRLLDLREELVVLSACNTSLSWGVQEHDLPAAFLAAGVRNVLLTLWTVADHSNLELMERFYRNLKLGAGISQSLRHAMLRTRQDFDSIRDWSAFMLVGAGG